MFEIELINNDVKVSASGSKVEISDSHHHSFSLIVNVDGKRTNLYRCISSKNLGWITIKKGVQGLNNNFYTVFDIYTSENYSEFDRTVLLYLQSDADDSLELVEITQKACDYKIKVDGNDTNTVTLDLEGNDVYKDISVQVYGASKRVVMQQSFIEMIKDGETMLYDESLCYYLVQDKEKSTEEYNEYTLRIKCMGDFNSLLDFTYQIPIIHYDNRDCVFNLVLKPNFEDRLNDNEMEEAVNNEYEVLNPYETIQGRNETNKDSDMMEAASIAVTSNLFEMYSIRQKKLEPITDIIIKGNIIEMQTNTYESNGNIVHNSMIALISRAVWCLAKSEFKNNKHYITVKCQRNYWNIERKTLLVVKNAEDISHTEKFLVRQTSDNQIIIERYNPNQ